MNSEKMSLWSAIAEIEQQMPLTVAKVGSILGIKLAEIDRSTAYVVSEATGPSFAEGLTAISVSLMIRPTQNFEDKSAFGMELEGTCISLDEVRRRFGELQVTQSPRGHSLEETTVWTTQRPWGYLSFAFKEKNPDCLFRVSFRKQRV